jgi:phage gp29-like protein
MSKRKRNNSIVVAENRSVEFSENVVVKRGVQATRGRSTAGAGFKPLDVMPNADRVLEKLGKGIEAYRDLLYDAHVESCLQSRKSGVLSYEFKITSDNTKSPEFELVQSVFERLDIYRIISEMLDANAFGYQPLEIYWGVKNSRIIVQDILGKPPEWFAFDGFNNLKFLTTEEPVKGESLFPRKFLIARHNPTYTNPAGSALLSRCYWSVQVKKNIIKFWTRFAEKYGTPFLYGTLPFNAEEGAEDVLLEKLDELAQDGTVVVDEGTKVEILEATKSSGADLYKLLIDFCNAEISKAILSHSATSDSTPGKLGNENMAVGVREDIVDADKRMVQNLFNQLIGWICDMNFGSNITELPKFSFFEEEDLKQALSERDERIFKSNPRLQATKVYYIRRYNFADDEILIADPAPATALAEHAAPTEAGSGKLPAKIDGQAAVDALKGKGLNAGARAMDKLMQPVIDFIDNGKSLEEISAKIIDVYGKMDTADFEEKLADALFWASALGRSTVERELME